MGSAVYRNNNSTNVTLNGSESLLEVQDLIAEQLEEIPCDPDVSNLYRISLYWDLPLIEWRETHDLVSEQLEEVFRVPYVIWTVQEIPLLRSLTN